MFEVLIRMICLDFVSPWVSLLFVNQISITIREPTVLCINRVNLAAMPGGFRTPKIHF